MSMKEIEEWTEEGTQEGTQEGTEEREKERTDEAIEEANEKGPPTQIRFDPYTETFTDYSLPENHPYRIFRLDHSSKEESDDEIV